MTAGRSQAVERAERLLATPGGMPRDLGQIARDVVALAASLQAAEQELAGARALHRKEQRDSADRLREKVARLQAAEEALRTLTSVPLTWHPRSPAEQASFNATFNAYRLAVAALGSVGTE